MTRLTDWFISCFHVTWALSLPNPPGHKWKLPSLFNGRCCTFPTEDSLQLPAVSHKLQKGYTGKNAQFKILSPTKLAIILYWQVTWFCLKTNGWRVHESAKRFMKMQMNEMCWSENEDHCAPSVNDLVSLALQCSLFLTKRKHIR